MDGQVCNCFFAHLICVNQIHTLPSLFTMLSQGNKRVFYSTTQKSEKPGVLQKLLHSNVHSIGQATAKSCPKIAHFS